MTTKQIYNVIPFSTRLTLMRVGRRLSQAQLAKEVDIDQALISRYENGLIPTEQHIKKLEDFFGVEFTHPKVEEAASVFCGTYKFDTLPTNTTKKNASLTLIAEPVY
jgi:transcriptional regulator with XRE-family HTH domain